VRASAPRKVGYVGRFDGYRQLEKKMIRLTTVAFAMVLASSAQAMPIAPPQKADNMLTPVREYCGAGRHRVRGVCVANVTTRHVRRHVRREIRRHY